MTEPSTDSTPRPPASYTSVKIALVCLTIVISVWAYLITYSTAKGATDEGPSSTSGIGVFVGLSIWASSVWSSIKKAEPETEIIFRQKHRSFQLKAGAIIACVVISVALFGIYVGQHDVHKQRLNAILNQVREATQKGAPIKQQFTQLVSQDPQNLPEYLDKCKKLEPVAYQYEATLEHVDNLFSQMQQEISEIKDENKNLQMIGVMRAVMAKDIEACKAIKREIQFAKQLEGMPESGRNAFYQTNIQPVVELENKIAHDEIAIVKDARARGVKLPESMNKLAGTD